MYCPNCGKEIPNDSKFCGSCGAQVRPVAQPQYQQPQYQQPQQQYAQPQQTKKEKKKNPLWLRIIIGLVAFAVGYGAVNALLSSDTKTENKSSVVSTTQATTEKPANPAYEEVFSSRYIVDVDSIIFMDNECFVQVLDDGMLEKLEYGYKNDVIKEMVNTIYFPVSDYTEDEKTALEDAVKELFAEYETLESVSLRYNMGTSYFTVVLTITDLDQAENIQLLVELGMMDSANVDYISMSKTIDNLTAAGYIQK